jgi:hypothetical protein
MNRWLLFVTGGLLVWTSMAGAAPWHHPLYLDGNGWWRQRIPVQITNDGPAPLNGFPVAGDVGTAASQLPLVGHPAESVRVCDAGGTEMLFVLRDPDGATVEQGPIPDGSRLLIPVECPPAAKVLYYVYFDNPQSWPVPDFLRAQAGLVNGDLEQGAEGVPEGWMHDQPDEQHQASWSTEHPQSGRRCLKTVVADGAEPTWIATRQRDIAIVGGARYRLQAWVKAQDVRGSCGWYLHIGNQAQPMLLAPMLPAGEGTFDWKQVEAGFTAPADADRLDLGTVLRGTGVAWFDNAVLQCLSPGAVRTEILPVESLSVRETGSDPAWYDAGADGTRPYRATVQALNLGDAAVERALVTVELGRLRARMRGRLGLDSILVIRDGRPVEHRLLGDQLLCAADLPARSSSLYHVYFAAAEHPSGAANAPAAAIADSPLNLVRNPGFEQGQPLPDGWTASGAAPQHGVLLDLAAPQREAFGARCARMQVPAAAPKAWRGWRQEVPVQPGRTYLVSAWVKCQDVRDGEVHLHAHFRRADGELSQRGGFASVGPPISGSTDWTLMSGSLSTPDDTATLQLHLTMENRGTVWHDGVTLVEVIAGDLLGIDSRHATSARDLTAWQVPAVIKVFRDDVPPDTQGPPAAVEICSARNEQESLQLAVRSPRDLHDVQVRVEPPVGPQDFELADLRIEVVGYVPIDGRSNYYQTQAPAWHRKIPASAGRGDGWAGMWPDPLLPVSTCDLKAGVTQPVWITVGVPRDAPAGDYRGRVRLESEGRELAAIPFGVHVWDFTLPDENHVAAIYDVRFGTADKLWGKSLDAAYPELIRFLAARRLCPDTIRPGPVFRRVDGKVTADFAAFDRAAQVYFDELKFPFAYTPWDLYLFGWGHPPKTIFGERPYEGEAPFESADRSRLRPEYKQVYQEMLRLYWQHLQEKGWHRRVVLYISDEPFDRHAHIRQQMKALCEMIHEVDPEIPIYSSTWKHVPEWDGYLNIWGIGHYGSVPPATMARLRSGAARLWFTTDGQMCTDTPYCAVERLLPHYCFQYGAEAYEFWGVAWQTYDPFRFGWHSFIYQTSEPGESTWVRYPNGDGFLLYPPQRGASGSGVISNGNSVPPRSTPNQPADPSQPGTHPGPVSSIRLEQAREGVEDYEYLHLLTTLVGAAQRAGKPVGEAERALRAAGDLVQIPNDGGYYSTRILPRPDRLYETRRSVAEAIESLKP